MSYQALYRRYRPARFADFVGQEAVIRTLRSQVASGRIAHAYLFCGTRGTGKTSAAKVLARAVNCERPADGEPCGECAVCRALSREDDLDILEIDAASNNGVDEIRDLREKVKYPPQTGRYRVYIIDEVHMLSAGAFNALLKTLEEPPAHAVFILATTEPQKLPATILSRCQRFDFRRIPAAQIAERLRVALADGDIPCEEAALRRIARAAEGGMRDAWSILDMCLGYAQEDGAGVTEALVLDVLGAADRSFLFAFADALLSADAPRAVALIDETMRRGREVQVFARDVSAHLRALLLAQVVGAERLADLLETTAEDAEAYAEQAARASRERLLFMLDLFLSSESDMKWSAQPRFALESAALKAAVPPSASDGDPAVGGGLAREADGSRLAGTASAMQLEALTARVAALEGKLRAGAVSAPPAPADAPQNAPQNAPTPAPAQPRASAPAIAPSPAPAAAPSAAEGERIWQEAVRILKQNPMLFGIVKNGRLATCENGLFTVVFERGGGAMYVRLLGMEDKNKLVADALSQAAGRPCAFRAALEGSVPEGDRAVLAAQAEEKRRAQENLNKIFTAFGRENVRVEEP